MPLSTWAQESYAVVKDGTITFYYDNNKASHEGNKYDVTKELASGFPSWKEGNFRIAIFDDSFSNYTPKTAAWWFNGCSSLIEVKQLENLNLSAATDMSYMFAGCSGLEKLDLSGLSTGNVKNMQWLFYRCNSLKVINLKGLDTKSVESMYQMFSQCSGLEQLDLSSFNTSNVEDMRKMFFNCQKLQTIYVGDGWTTLYVGNSTDMFLGCIKLVGGNGTKCDGFGISSPINDTYARIDTSDKPGFFTYKNSVTAEAYIVLNGSTLTFYYDGNKDSHEGIIYEIAEDYSGDGNFPAWCSSNISKVSFDSSFSSFYPKSTARWFHSCSELTEIDNMNNLITDEVTNMASMFYGCKSLNELNLSGFNTSKVTNMYCMFYECDKLGSLDLRSFNTSNVTSLVAMFYGCSNLKTLDLSSFNTKNAVNMEYMFFNCSSLKTIYADEGWNTDNISMETGDMMFWGCTSLVGGEGTVCDGITLVSYLYARIDEYVRPGYFTRGATSLVNGIEGSNNTDRHYYYNLDGTRSIKLTKGIYIINGKKIKVN
jgi:surface protein